MQRYVRIEIIGDDVLRLRRAFNGQFPRLSALARIVRTVSYTGPRRKQVFPTTALIIAAKRFSGSVILSFMLISERSGNRLPWVLSPFHFVKRLGIRFRLMYVTSSYFNNIVTINLKYQCLLPKNNLNGAFQYCQLDRGSVVQFDPCSRSFSDFNLSYALTRITCFSTDISLTEAASGHVHCSCKKNQRSSRRIDHCIMDIIRWRSFIGERWRSCW